MHLYVGSDLDLPIIAWNPLSPGFHVVPLARDAPALRRRLRSSRVYFAGGHEGCGCSFNVGRAYAGGLELPADRGGDLGGLMRARRDLDDLGEYLRRHQVRQLYHCWVGTEPEPIACRTRATVEMIVSREFRLRDRQHIEIVPSLAPALPGPRRAPAGLARPRLHEPSGPRRVDREVRRRAARGGAAID